MGKLEFIFPLVAAIRINHAIDQTINKNSENNRDSPENKLFQKNYTKWTENLKNVTISENQIEHIAHNIYSDEDRRTYNIENKGSWLFVGVGVAISLLSIVLGFSFEPEKLSILQVVSIGFFLWSISNLILAAIGVYKAMKIGRRLILVTSDFSESIKKEKTEILDWAAKYLAAVESNLDLIRKKTNLIDVSQQHFVRGLLFIIIGFGFLTWQIISAIFFSGFELEGFEITSSLITKSEILDNITANSEIISNFSTP